MESTQEDTIRFGRVPTLEIEQAMEHCDMARVWALANDGIAPSDFYEALKLHSFNSSRQTRKGRAVVADHNSTMFMCPVIMSSSMLHRAQDSSLTDKNGVVVMLAQEVGRWTGYKSESCMLASVTTYSYVASKDPVDVRRLLNLMAWREAAEAGVGPGNFINTLPPDAPQLCFLLGAFTRLNAWPDTPGLHERSTQELNAKIAATLRFALEEPDDVDTEGGTRIEVAPPMFGDKAIEQGLMMWLTALSQYRAFTAWDVYPGLGDRVDLVIQLDSPDAEWVTIPLRTYQIGVDGVERVIAHLSACCGTTPPGGHGLRN